MRLLIVLGLVALYLPLGGAIARITATDPYAAHILLVPVTSVILIWSRRTQLRAAARSCSPAGLALLGGALPLLGLAYMSGSYTAHVVSLILMIAGAGLWLRGPQWLRQAGFPLGFLLLMLPPPPGLIAAVTPPIQHFIASSAARILSFFQIPVERQGFWLHLPNATLSIDEGCNGLRFLLVLFVITTALAHVWVPTPGRRYVLMLAAIPTAVLANAIRVSTIAVTAYLFGPQVATGWAHDYIGRSTWLLAIVALLALAITFRSTVAAASPIRLDGDHQAETVVGRVLKSSIT